MKRFTPQFQGSAWSSGTSVLHVYLTPRREDQAAFDLAARARAALAPYPLLPLPDHYLHITLDMVADTPSTTIDQNARDQLTTALHTHLHDVAPVEALLGPPIANKAGALVDVHDDADLEPIRERVRAALTAARGPSVLQHPGGRLHMSLGYAYASADGDAANSALRALYPRLVPITFDQVHLLDVTFTQQRLPTHAAVGPHQEQTGWVLSWEPIASIPLAGTA